MTPELERTLAAAGDDFAGWATSHDGPGHADPGALRHERRRDSELASGQSGYASACAHPVYVEAGGQVSDSGRLLGADGEARGSSA
jgi:hypothetical protein